MDYKKQQSEVNAIDVFNEPFLLIICLFNTYVKTDYLIYSKTIRKDSSV